MEIAKLIDQAKKTAGIESDSAFSKYLGLSRTAVGNWRTGVSLPDTVSCERLAGLTGQPLARVLGLVGEARAHTREEKAVWRKLAATAALLAVMVFPALPHSAQAADMASQQGQSRHYAKWLLGLARQWVAWKLRPRKPSPGNLEASICA